MQTAGLWMFAMLIYNIGGHFAVISFLAVKPDAKFRLSECCCQLSNFRLSSKLHFYFYKGLYPARLNFLQFYISYKFFLYTGVLFSCTIG